MKNCKQGETNVWEHGQQVHLWYQSALKFLHSEQDPDDLKWKMPTWMTTHRETILKHLIDFAQVKRYQVYHDCGKPYCVQVSQDCKSHFPSHAQVSAQVWQQLFKL